MSKRYCVECLEEGAKVVNCGEYTTSLCENCENELFDELEEEDYASEDF